MEKIKVVMADDHAMFRNSIARLLESEYDDIEIVAQATDGVHLLNTIYHLPEDCFPEVCILDMDMPKMSGPQVLPVLLERYPNLKVLTLSIFANEHSVLYMIRHGAKGFINKGSDIEDLYAAIVTVAQGGYYHPEVTESRIRRRASSEDVTELSEKEMQFLQYCITEKAYKEIAAEMHVSLRTVHGYRDKLFQKLDCQTRIGLAVFALTSGTYLPKK